MFMKTALDIWKEEVSNKSIITLCKTLDRALGNGIQVGVITELAGASGCGKTQLCYQLAVNVQFPKEVSGLGGKAVYIDTNQGFNPLRLKQIGSHSSKLFHNVFQKVFNRSADEKFMEDNILSNISYVYCKDYIELIAAIELLKEKLLADSEVKLIVIDSFSYLFRSVECHTVRTRILYQLLTDLQILADKFKLAVIITNELTTRVLGSDEYFICPALGDSQGHKIGQRIILGKTKDGTNHLAYLEKCFNSARKFVPFKISEVGIRGVGK